VDDKGLLKSLHYDYSTKNYVLCNNVNNYIKSSHQHQSVERQSVVVMEHQGVVTIEHPNVVVITEIHSAHLHMDWKKSSSPSRFKTRYDISKLYKVRHSPSLVHYTCYTSITDPYTYQILHHAPNYTRTGL
jgi:hypothetical protein